MSASDGEVEGIHHEGKVGTAAVQERPQANFGPRLDCLRQGSLAGNRRRSVDVGPAILEENAESDVLIFGGSADEGVLDFYSVLKGDFKMAITALDFNQTSKTPRERIY